MIRSTTPLISLRDVRKSYRGFELGPVELEVEGGYVVAVVGPNGSGKSTLFGMLMNLIQPDSGERELFGLSYPQDEVEIKQRVGYLPERSVGHDGMRVKDLAEFVSYWYPRWDQMLYTELVGPLDIEPDTPFGHLSRGVQRRLSFALALATGAELLLLDEPTAGLDPLARNEMLEDISRFMQAEIGGRDRALVFSTHVVEEVRRVADYVAVLVDGEFLGLCEKDALLERWRTFWVDGEPEEGIAGAVEIEGGSSSLTRIVSDSPEETAEALVAENIRIVRTEAMDLEEILPRRMRRSTNSRRSRT